MITTQLNAIPSTRTNDEHEQWTSALISSMFLGCADPWTKPQFQWMLDGFVAILEDTSMTMTQVCPLYLCNLLLTSTVSSF